MGKVIRTAIIFGAAAIIVALFGFFHSSLSLPFIYARSFFQKEISGSESETLRRLEAENISLRSEINALKDGDVQGVLQARYHYFEASLYSRFPFNNRGIVVINKGSIDGVGLDMPVLSQDNIIFGRIKSVKRTQSEVVTIFDSLWKNSVFLGEDSKKAVLIGGASPFIDLIPKDASASSGIAVFNSSEDFPYGLPLGEIGELSLSKEASYLRADLLSPYNLETLGRVRVIKDFP